MVKVIWTISAIEDLHHIGEFIEKDSVKYAKITVQQLFESVNILETHAKAGKKVPEFDYDTVRQLIRGNYRIVYKILDKNRIDILTVHHSARLIKNIPPFNKKL